MKKLLAIFGILLTPLAVYAFPMTGPSNIGYELNGLYYQGGYGNYTWGAYSAIIEALDGNDTRLATEEELNALFEHFNLIGANASDTFENFLNFEQYFDYTSGSQMYSPGKSYFIDGIYQKPEGADYIPRVFVYSSQNISPNDPLDDITHVIFENSYESDNYYFDFGISAWTVTPTHATPEPSTIILLGFCAIVLKIKVFLRKIFKKRIAFKFPFVECNHKLIKVF